MLPVERRITIGSLVFDGVDQIDLTGPFEVLSRLPNATLRLYGLSVGPVRDVGALRLLPDALIGDAPQLDVLHVPAGSGQEALMAHEAVLGWLTAQAAGATAVFSVCTGALLLGAASLLRGRRATTHWASHHLLPYFGATAVDERVVVDGNYMFAAGVDGWDRRRTPARGGAAGDRRRTAHPARHRLRPRAAVRQRDPREGPGFGPRGLAERGSGSRRSA